MSSTKGLKRQGDGFSRDTFKLVNQTGAALVQGSLVALNADFVNGTYIATDLTALDWRRNAIAVTTENATRLLAVSLGAVATGKVGEFGFNGIFPVLTGGAVNKGNFFGATNASAAMTAYANQAALDALALPTGILGIALETTAVAAAISCIFNGEAWRNLIGGGA